MRLVFRDGMVSGPCWSVGVDDDVIGVERPPTGSSGKAAGKRFPARSSNGSSPLLGCRGRAINGSVLTGRGSVHSSDDNPVCNWPTILFMRHVLSCCQKDEICKALENPVLSPVTLLVRRSKNACVSGPVVPHELKANG